jgi:hypothetical protein
MLFYRRKCFANDAMLRGRAMSALFFSQLFRSRK